MPTQHYQHSGSKNVKPKLSHISKIMSIVLLLVIIGAVVHFWPKNQSTSINSSDNKPIVTNVPERPFNKNTYSIDQPGSVWWVVNKQRALSKDYTPPDLVVPDVALRLSSSAEQMRIRQVVGPAVKKLFNDAKLAGYSLVFASGYRSYTYQEQLYGTYVSSDGQANADTFSARPGHSEHQTGLAFDVQNNSEKCTLEACYSDTPEGKWLAANAHKYGFVIRYPKDKISVTGYTYEPWHLRFVGLDLANEINSKNTTLEEFFGLPAAPDYNPKDRHS